MLFSCIENLLRSLNVRNFVLPAADEAESLWTNKFGFKKIAEDEVCPFSLFTFFVTNLFTYMFTFFFGFFPAAEGIQEGISLDGISRDINASQIGGTVLKSSDAGTVITQNQENNCLCGRKDTKINYGGKKKKTKRNETKNKIAPMLFG